jgi:hypothetical protein
MFALRRRKQAGPPAGEDLRAYLFRPSPDVAVATREGRAVLLDVRRERYYGLDEVGTTIWEGLQRGLTFTEIVDALESEYDAPRATLEDDVSRFVARLASSNLVVPS